MLTFGQFKDGQATKASSTEGKFHCRASQLTIDQNGFAKEVSVLMRNIPNAFKSAIEAGKPVADVFPNMANASIRTVHSVEQSYDSQQPMINPSTNEVLTHLGAPIYRETVLTFTNEADELLVSDQALAAQGQSVSVTEDSVEDAL